MAECEPWEGTERRYQEKASDVLYLADREQPHWAWIRPECGTDMCLTPDHLVGSAPVDLGYPRHVCIYCGRAAFTRDHILPRRWSGETMRKFVAVVPSCGTCNSSLGETLTWSITERRAVCHKRLRKKFLSVLRTVDHTTEELAEYGDVLRDYIRDGMERKAVVLDMLAFPTDEAYDLRALQKSGIEDPYAIGLLLDKESDEVLAAVRAA